jgi:ubiquinone/menaquinone biosynthesis C-methylase UbiE
MEKINYNKICKSYDDVRDADVGLINQFLEVVEFDHNTRVLDIGCGTGNYTSLLQKVTGASLYGIDPSSGMLEKAVAKNGGVSFCLGNAEEIPHPDHFFDFVYMTDVIHHVKELDRMFKEIGRVIKKNGFLCIVTQSHDQIDQRPTSYFFPGTAIADKARYPEFNKIEQASIRNEFSPLRVDTIEDGQAEIGNEYLKLIENKGYSMLYLISDEEYLQGLQKLKQALCNGPFVMSSGGTSLMWFTKK